MSNEHIPEFNPAFFEGYRPELKQSSIDEVDLAIEKKIQALENLYLECQDHTEHIVLKTRIEQLATLMSPVMRMAKYDLYGESINLEDAAAHTVTNYSPDWQTGSEVDDQSKDALRRGVNEGTNDLLEILAPEDVKNQGFDSVYFMPWRFDFFYKKHTVVPLEDGTVSVNLPTRLPNIAINYHYTPESNLPRRTVLCVDQE